MEQEQLSVQDFDEAEEPVIANPDPTPLDPDEFFAKSAFRIVYQTNNFFLPQIRDLIEKGEVLNLRPEYQRRLRWTSAQKSRLIESLLLNIPIPPIFLYESDAARYEVMDGQQRLNAVREFLVGGYTLTGLQVLKPLNGIHYSRCPPRIKRALDRASLSAIVLLLESEAAEASTRNLTIVDIRRFIFDRLNTGGTKLNAQEIRNAIYPGHFNASLIKLSRFSLFTSAFGIPPYTEPDPSEYYENEARKRNGLYSTMGDCQLVLRFFALREVSNIRGSMKSVLDRAMESRLGLTLVESEALESEYKDRFSFLYEMFDEKPFLLPPDENNRRRLSAAIYDASMVAIDRCWNVREYILADKAGVQRRMAEALEDDDSLVVLTGQGNTANAVRDRIDLLQEILYPSAEN